MNVKCIFLKTTFIIFLTLVILTTAISEDNKNIGKQIKKVIAIKEKSNNIKNGKWISAKDLKQGMKVLGANGKWITITGVEIVKGSEKTYNFEIKDIHTYTVGEQSVVVHNQCINETMGCADPDDPEYKRRVQSIFSDKNTWAATMVGIFKVLPYFVKNGFTYMVTEEAIVIFTNETHLYSYSGEAGNAISDGRVIFLSKGINANSMVKSTYTGLFINVLGHELGHVVFRRAGLPYGGFREERYCDYYSLETTKTGRRNIIYNYSHP